MSLPGLESQRRINIFVTGKDKPEPPLDLVNVISHPTSYKLKLPAWEQFFDYDQPAVAK